MSRDEFSADSLLGAVIDDRFQILEKLGEGGMGAIYKARQISVDRVVALKILLHDQRGDPISVERFRHEAYLASRLKHPNAIVIHDFGQTVDGLLYIAMEFLGGETLKQRLRRVGPLKIEGAVKIMTQTLRTIAEAHRMGMVHRDLKPDNVFLTEMEGDRDFVKVLDFGIAKLTAVQDGVEGYQGGLTMAGKIYGTPNYMSPEQIRGKPVEPQSDLYSLGIIFYELLAGRLPFVAPTPVEVMMAHLRDLPPALRSLRGEINVELERTVLRALEKDRRARYQSADEFLEALENYKFNSGFYAVPAQLAARAGRVGSQPDTRPTDENVSRPVAPPPDAVLDPADESAEAQSFHDERTFLEFGDEPQPTPAAEEKTFFETDDGGDASQDGDLDDGVMMGPSIDTFGGGGIIPTGLSSRAEESTMLELDDGELMEVEPSRIVPIADVEAAARGGSKSAAPAPEPKATRTGMPVQRFEPPESKAPARLPEPAPAPPPARSPPPAGSDKRTLMGHPAPAPSPPAPPAASPPPPRAVGPASADAPSVPALPTVKAPPREINPRPTAVGLPAGGPVRSGGAGLKTWLAVGAAVALTTAAVVGVVLLDPFGAGAAAEPQSPPKLVVSSDPPAVEVFDRNLFVGETPLEHPVTPTGEAHSLQFSKGKSSWRARLDETRGEVWLHVRLPASGSGELGAGTVRTDPSGATIRLDGKEIGRTPLTLLGSNGTVARFQVELPGFASQEKDVTLSAPGTTVDLTLARP